MKDSKTTSVDALFGSDLLSNFTEAEEANLAGGGKGHGKRKGKGRGRGRGGSGSGDDGQIFFSRGPGNSRELFFFDGNDDGRFGGSDDIFFSRGPGNSRELFFTN